MTSSHINKRSNSEVRTSLRIPKTSFSFGIQEYRCTKPKIFKPTVKLAHILKSKNKNFVDLYAKSKEFLPSPDKYEVKDVWVKKSNNLRFSKVPRLSFTESIMKQSPRTPGPGQYNPNQIITKKRGLKSTTKRYLGFIDEAIYKGENNPL